MNPAAICVISLNGEESVELEWTSTGTDEREVLPLPNCPRSSSSPAFNGSRMSEGAGVIGLQQQSWQYLLKEDSRHHFAR